MSIKVTRYEYNDEKPLFSCERCKKAPKAITTIMLGQSSSDKWLYLCDKCLDEMVNRIYNSRRS